MEINKSLLCVFLLTSVLEAHSKESFTFSSAYLTDIDFNNSEVSGDYYVDIFLNGHFLDTRKVNFNIKDNSLIPCLNGKDLELLRINMDSLKVQINSDDECYDIFEVKYIDYKFDLSNLRLNISVPNAYMYTDDMEYKVFDMGEDVFYANYILGGRISRANRIAYSRVNSSLNINDWKIGSSFYFEDANGTKSAELEEYYTERYYANKKLVVKIGEFYGGFRRIKNNKILGFSIGSDNELLGNYSYQPSIKGVAEDSSLIVVRQNDLIVATENVPAGPFSITSPGIVDGLYEVEIIDSQGRIKQFSVYNNSLPLMLKERDFSYLFFIGGVENKQGYEDFSFIGELSYGVNDRLTAYSSFQGALDENNFSLGISNDFGKYGALSFGVDNMLHKKKSSQKVSAEYFYNQYHNSLSFSIGGYLFLNENIELNNDHNEGGYAINANINYSLGKFGTYGLSYDKFYSSSGESERRTFQYNISKKYFSLSTRLSNNAYINSKEETLFSVNMSIPFSVFDRKHYTSLSFNQNSRNNKNKNISLNGEFGYKNIRYHIQSSMNDLNGSKTNNNYLNLSHQGDYGYISGGVSDSKNDTSYFYSINGGLLVHPKTILMVPYVGQTSAIVNLNGIQDVSLVNGVKSNNSGYGFVTNLEPYKKNSIAIDPRNLPTNVEIKNINKTIVPTKGSVSLVDFFVRSGANILVQLDTDNEIHLGSSVIVRTKDGTVIDNTYTNDDNSIYITSVSDTIHVSIPSASCSFYIYASDIKNSNVKGVLDLTKKCEN
ncbi:fimbria/pilus outer membrane usher protein [Vibrio parahaemolyticus]|nr:fimbria/pilus outer membrane usher protein [Vibrio parahaemolyticus]